MLSRTGKLQGSCYNIISQSSHPSGSTMSSLRKSGGFERSGHFERNHIRRSVGFERCHSRCQSCSAEMTVRNVSYPQKCLFSIHFKIPTSPYMVPFKIPTSPYMVPFKIPTSPYMVPFDTSTFPERHTALRDDISVDGSIETLRDDCSERWCRSWILMENCPIHALIKRISLVVPTASDLAEVTKHKLCLSVEVCPWLSIEKKEGNCAVWFP